MDKVRISLRSVIPHSLPRVLQFEIRLVQTIAALRDLPLHLSPRVDGHGKIPAIGKRVVSRIVANGLHAVHRSYGAFRIRIRYHARLQELSVRITIHSVIAPGAGIIPATDAVGLG